MTDYEKALANARDALAKYQARETRHYIDEAMEGLLAAIDAARGQAVYVVSGPWLFKNGEYFASGYMHADAKIIAAALNATPPAAAVPAGYDEDEIADACIMAEVSDSKYEAIITYLGDNRRRAAANKENNNE